MPIKTLTPAASLPVSVKTALRHCRALQDEVDLVNLYVKAATQAVEEYTGRCLITQTFLLQMERWPTFEPTVGFGLGMGIQSAWKQQTYKRFIPLGRSPLIAISSVKYWPIDGGAQITWDPSNYSADVGSLPGRLFVGSDIETPQVATRFDAIEITFTAGMGTTEGAMSPMLQAAVLQLARHLYDNPSAVDADGRVTEMPLSFKWFLRSQKVGL